MKKFFDTSKKVFAHSTIKKRLLTTDFNHALLSPEIEFCGKILNKLSGEYIHKIYQNMHRASFQEIQNNVHKGRELITHSDMLDPLKSLEMFEQAVGIADTILENSVIKQDDKNNLILAQAYAGYADVLRKFKPEETKTRKKMVEKALQLDPKNEIANELNFDMHCYDIPNLKV
jgi:hypothetical protein